MKNFRIIFLVVACTLILSAGAWADSVTYTTVSDFQKADITNGTITFLDDGEVTTNTVLNPVSLTITSTALPKGLFGHALCSFADTLVVSGGVDASTYSQAVYLNTVANGDLGNWVAGPDLPTGIGDHQMVKIGKYIYCFGGRTSSGTSNKVYKSEIFFSGNSLSAWQSAGTLPVPLERFALVTYRSKVFVLGGLSGSAQNKVYTADIDPSGNLMTWQSLGVLPTSVYDLKAVVYGTSMIVIGGNNGTVDTANVYKSSFGTGET
jgi:N-acetylneuraminic acid mutarotase